MPARLTGCEDWLAMTGNHWPVGADCGGRVEPKRYDIGNRRSNLRCESARRPAIADRKVFRFTPVTSLDKTFTPDK
jgi:hypothetical protein